MTGAAAFTVRLPGFAGSLEELVLAVRAQRVDLAELPLGPLASQLLAFLRASSAQNGAYQRFDEAIEWADLAARLIRWKSLLIAPAHGPEERAVAEAELRQEIDERFRALERAHIGCLREWLADRWLAAGGALEATGQAEDGVAQAAGESALFPSLWTLRKKFQTLGRRARQSRDTRRVVDRWVAAEAVSLADTLTWLRARLAVQPPETALPLGNLLGEVGQLRQQLLVFLGVLELARQGDVRLLPLPNDEWALTTG
jgi:segregation and condensation protein A